MSYFDDLVQFQEWGASGASKGQIIKAFVQALESAQITNMVWEIVKPGKGSSDFEVSLPDLIV